MALITSGVRHPRNASPRSQGTIHDDDIATDLGFRGGAVAGSIHLDQFGPMLVETFGRQWFETGSLGLHFLHPLTDREPVEAVIDTGNVAVPASDCRFDTTMAMPDGTVVAAGTVSVGHVDSRSPVSSRDRRPMDPSSLRMLARTPIGMKLGPVIESPSKGDQRERVSTGLMTAPLDWYVNESPWGGAVCSPLTISRMMTGAVLAPIEKTLGKCIGLYGALELRHVHGPLFLDEDYLVNAVVTDVSETPKTEVFWCDVEARRASDPDAGIAATFTVMTRLMKASSPYYAD